MITIKACKIKIICLLGQRLLCGNFVEKSKHVSFAFADLCHSCIQAIGGVYKLSCIRCANNLYRYV